MLQFFGKLPAQFLSAFVGTGADIVEESVPVFVCDLLYRPF